MRVLERKWKQAIGLLLIGLLASVTVLLAIAEFHEEIAEPFLAHLDTQILALVHAHTSPLLTAVMFRLTWIGSPAVLIPLIAALVLLLWWKQKRDEAVVLLAAMLGASALDTALKLHFKRVRPDVAWAFVHEHSFSFPSGHSVLAVALYGTLVYLGIRFARPAWLRVGMILGAALLIFGIGYSRMYLGVHYPSDVAAGYMVGCMWLVTVIGADWIVRREERISPVPST
ncbi:MAG: phosphatase PAP2 family protein [Acidobacteriaceae bacterium]